MLDIIIQKEPALIGTMLAGVQAGEHGGMGRDGPTGGSEAAGINGRVFGDALEIRGGFAVVAIEGHMLSPCGVHDDEDDVR